MLDVPIKSRGDVGKLRIAEALERLLTNRNIEELNVTQICGEAGISRQTFYRHFKDKYDIAQWVWTGITERYVREIGRSLTWDEAAMGIGRTCAGNALVLSNLMAPSSDYQAIPAYVERTVIGWFEETATKYHGAKLTPKLKFMIAFTVAGIMRVMPCGSPGEAGLSAQDYTAYIRECIPRELYELFTPIA